MEYFNWNDTYVLDEVLLEEIDAPSENIIDIYAKRITFVRICGIVTNLALLVLLLVRLVKDVQKRNMDKARWAKRHVLVAMCGVHLLNLGALLIYSYLHENGNGYKSKAICWFISTLSYSFPVISSAYSIVLAYQIMLQLITPSVLFGPKQVKFWSVTHVFIWVLSFLSNGIFCAVTYELFTVDVWRVKPKSYCVFTGSDAVFIWHALVFSIMPVVIMSFISIVTCIGSCCTTPRIPDCVDDKMHQWLSLTRVPSIFFLIMHALFSCATLLPQVIVLILYKNMLDDGHMDFLMHYLETSLLKEIYFVLFPVCCLMLAETWLCFN